MPVAVNGIWIVAGTLAGFGVTAMDTNGEALTIKSAGLLVTDPIFAVMLVVPDDWPVTNPKLVTVATLVSDEAQVATPFRLKVVPSL